MNTNSSEKLNQKLLEQQYDINKLDSIQEQQSYLENESYFAQQKVGKSNNNTSITNKKNKQKEFPVKVFQQRNPYILCFEFFLFFLTYLVFFIYPIEIFYQITVLPRETADSAIKGLIFAFFVIHIVIKFNISFFLRGRQIFDRKAIRWNYIRKVYNGRFFWDSISLLGLLIDTFSINFPYKWLTYLIFYTKVVFMVEFDTFILQFLQLNRKSLAAYQLLRLFLTVLFISNLAACVFYRIGIETLDIYGANWIGGIPYQNVDGELKWIYLYSMYWSIATMATVAYGDVTPKNPIETLYSCFIMFIATVSFGYTINQVLDIVGNIQSGSERVEKQITAIQRYMRNKNVNEDLQNRIIHYVEYQLIEDKERDKETESTIISMLPPHMRAELYYEVNTFFFKNFSWTDRFSDQFITALSFEIEELNLMEDAVLYEPSYVENEDDINLYYLAKGSIEIKIDLPQFNQGQGLNLNVVNENNFIGLYQFVCGTLVKEVLYCKSSVKVFIIKRQKFLEIIQNFPEDLKLWNIYKNRIIQQRRYEEFNLHCYNCLTTDHIIEECSLMTRKKTMLDKREREIFQLLSQKQSEINEDNDLSNRKSPEFNHVSSSQLQAEQRISQKGTKREGEGQGEKGGEIKQNLDVSESSSENIDEIKEQVEDPHSQSQNLSKKNNKSVHIVEDEDNKGRNKGQSIILGSKQGSKAAQDSFIQLQEQNINDHIKHQVYNESEHDKWGQRAKIQERINKKQALHQKRTILGLGQASSDDVLIQIINSIQTVLQQNNMDINLLQTISASQTPLRRTSFAPSVLSNNQNFKSTNKF